MNLYFIRHCQSEGNAKEILASRMDFPLSAEGHSQAQLIAGTFYKSCTIDKIISSPLTRAAQTAGYFSELFNIAVEHNDKLVEHDLGIFTGMSYAEVKTRDDYEHDRSSRWDWRPEKGESYQDIYHRIADFFQQIDTEEPGGDILIVSHAVTMRMIHTFLTQSAPNYPLKIAGNGETWRTEFKGPGRKHEIEVVQKGIECKA